VTTETIAESPTGGRPEPARVPVGRRRAVRWSIAAVAAVLCLVAIPQPLWKATLEAPQYHGDGALHITAYGDRLKGDICELNDLNHYIGMQRLGEPHIPCGSVALGRGENTVGRIAPEMVLWLPSAIVASIACVAAMVTRRRWLRRVSLLFMWGLPVGVLAMTQYHLYEYGHDLDRTAAFRPDEFTPRVLFHSRIYQFDVNASTGLGLNLVILAALLVTFGSWAVTKTVTWVLPKVAPVWSAKLNRRLARSAAAAVALVVALVAATGFVTATPAAARSGVATSTAADDAGAELAARLAAARPGDVVVIEPGVYRGHFLIDTPIEVTGVGRPVLDGGGEGTVLTVDENAVGASISGLRIVSSGPGPSDTPAGLRVLADDVLVADVEVADSYTGIQVGGANGVTIRDCVVEGVKDAVLGGELHATGDAADITGIDPHHEHLPSMRMRGDAISVLSTSNTLIEGNVVTDARDGIYLSFATEATVRDNEVNDSRYAIHGMYADHLVVIDNHFEGNLAGAILMYGGPFDVQRNTIMHSKSPSTGIGLVIKDGTGAVLRDNVIVANRVGLKVDNGGAARTGGSRAVIEGNTFGMNQIGVELMTASSAVFTGNGFVENAIQIVIDGKMDDILWSHDDTGNYWSNYKGYDSDGDGIGDVDFVQGGTVAHTLTRSPVVLALASGPAFRLLQAVEDRWAPENPIARDPAPLMDLRSPQVDDSMLPARASAWFGISGAMAAVLCAALLFNGRRVRRLAV